MTACFNLKWKRRTIINNTQEQPMFVLSRIAPTGFLSHSASRSHGRCLRLDSLHYRGLLRIIAAALIPLISHNHSRNLLTITHYFRANIYFLFFYWWKCLARVNRRNNYECCLSVEFMQ